MYRDPAWMLAAFLIGGKQEFVSAKQPRAWGSALQQRENQAARRQSITRAIHAFCSGSRRSAHGDQPRLRSAIDTSAATAFSGTLKPALRRPLGVSTKTRRRRDIRPTIANGLERSRLEINHWMEW